MKLATGITALFLTLAVGVHSVLQISVDITGLIIALLFLFGGAFAFQIPGISSTLFFIAFLFASIIGITTDLIIMYVWATLAIILAFMSEKASKQMVNEKVVTR